MVFNRRFGPAVGGDARDAVTMLTQDHRRIEQSFVNYYQEPGESLWYQLARKALSMLKIHMEIEEEVFYPAYLIATTDAATQHDSMVEHEMAKKLIEDIEHSDPADEYFEAMMRVLWKTVRRHMSEEEQEGGVFEKARASKLDLIILGMQLSKKEAELTEHHQMQS